MSKKVSEFNDASLPLSGNEFIPIVQNGLNRKTPISEIKGDVESVNGKTGEIVLNADDIDDGNTTNKFATDEQLTQIETNESDIVSINVAQGVQDGLISDLRTDVDTNASDITGLQVNVGVNTSNISNQATDIIGLRTDVDTNTSSISTLQTDVSANENNITDLENNKLNSITSGEPTGADVIGNIVTLTQAEYDAGTPLATTIYIIT